mgnify:CR=1 FL=1
MTKEEIASRLKQYRINAGFEAKDVAEKLISANIIKSVKSFYNWESGRTQPDADTFMYLCNLYGVKDIMQAFGFKHTSKESRELSEAEFSHIQKYRSLTKNGRKAVDAVTQVLYEAEKVAVPDNIIRINVRRLPLYAVGASAGAGNPLDDSPYDIVEVGPEAPLQTSFLLKADGDSMEPLIHNDEMLYIKQQNYVEDGEIGIFWYDDCVYVKEQEHKDGKLYLISLNPRYKSIEIHDDSIHCFGKVLNKELR